MHSTLSTCIAVLPITAPSSPARSRLSDLLRRRRRFLFIEDFEIDPDGAMVKPPVADATAALPGILRDSRSFSGRAHREVGTKRGGVPTPIS